MGQPVGPEPLQTCITHTRYDSIDDNFDACSSLITKHNSWSHLFGKCDELLQTRTWTVEMVSVFFESTMRERLAGSYLGCATQPSQFHASRVNTLLLGWSLWTSVDRGSYFTPSSKTTPSPDHELPRNRGPRCRSHQAGSVGSVDSNCTSRKEQFRTNA